MTNTKGASKTRIKTFPFDAGETLDTPEAIAEYLTAALESADASSLQRPSAPLLVPAACPRSPASPVSPAKTSIGRSMEKPGRSLTRSFE